ncbi:hypothetical protein ACW95P_01840 [Candidatus Mycoplasma pogonae]
MNNLFIFTGRLLNDPKEFSDGKFVEVNIAELDMSNTDRKNFLKFLATNKTKELVIQHLKKGDLVIIHANIFQNQAYKPDEKYSTPFSIWITKFSKVSQSNKKETEFLNDVDNSIGIAEVESDYILE